MKKIVIGLSGGMDSATLLGLLLEQGYTVYCCVFYYGSKHNKWENLAAENIIDFYQNKNQSICNYSIDISKVMQNFKSNLLLSGEEIPEGHYASENMRKTVIPSRNLIMASIMAGLAESIGAEKIALGVHSGDHYIYPDCRTEFVKALDTTIFLSSDRKVEVIAPLDKEDKSSILQKGYGLDITVPYHLTRTCYKDQPVSCGICGACNERLLAFGAIGIPDPIQYENR